MAIIRSMSTKEGDHAGDDVFCIRGYLPQGVIRYPTFGSLLSKELARPESELPNFISIGPNRGLSPGSYDPGFLGAKYAPLMVGDAQGAAGDVDMPTEGRRHPPGARRPAGDGRHAAQYARGVECEVL